MVTPTYTQRVYEWIECCTGDLAKLSDLYLFSLSGSVLWVGAILNCLVATWHAQLQVMSNAVFLSTGDWWYNKGLLMGKTPPVFCASIHHENRLDCMRTWPDDDVLWAANSENRRLVKNTAFEWGQTPEVVEASVHVLLCWSTFHPFKWLETYVYIRYCTGRPMHHDYKWNCLTKNLHSRNCSSYL